MNSQVYCLPQKLGWNALQCTSYARAEKRAEVLDRPTNMADRKPYFTVQFHAPPLSEEAISRFQKQYPRLSDRSVITDQEAVNAIYKTEYGFKYGPDFLPAYHRPSPPVVHECLPDPVLRRRHLHHPSFSSINPPSYNVYDPHRGAHEWRELIPKPGMYIWQPLQKIPILGNSGQRSTMLPVRVKQHDPNHEKDRWDTIRTLARHNAVSYGYRRDMPGYAGHRQQLGDLSSCVEKDVVRPNLGMVSTSHAFHKLIPLQDSRGPCDRDFIRPMGAACRLVTIGDPQKPQSQPQPQPQLSACE